MVLDMEKIRLARTTKHKKRASADRSYAPVEKVLGLSRKDHEQPHRRVLGPLTAINYDELSQIVLVDDKTTESAPQPFRTSKVVP